MKKKPSIMIRVVGFSARSNYDNYMYAMFLTSSCASETIMCNLPNRDSPKKEYTSSSYRRSHSGSSQKIRKACGIYMCKPSAESARPARVITNLRFMMLLSHPSSDFVLDEMLLDEINILDTFKRNVMEITV